MTAKTIKESASIMRQDIEKRRNKARERFAALVAQPARAPSPHHYPSEYVNPSRARINEVLSALFHKAEDEVGQEKKLPVNDPA